MRLIDNKGYTIDNKVFDRLYWIGTNLWGSNGYIWNKQKIVICTLTTSNFLMRELYNEIKR
jgi:hypothetical protein